MVFNRRSLEKACLPRKTNVKIIPYKNVFKKNSSETTSSSVDNMGASTGMNVFVRVRPLNEKEYQDNFRTVTQIVDEKMLVFDPKEEDEAFFFRGVKQKGRDMTKKLPKEIKFLFDGVFGPDKSNLDVHLSTTNSIISRLLEGYNCSVFVYGATGAGKTHTMLGNRDNPGIMYHTMADLYDQINTLSHEKDFHVGVTFVEVYNENVHNLLHPSGPMHLREDSNGVTVAGLKIEDIFNAEQLLEKLAKGNANRTQHPTDANAESSRSHAVFQVYMRMVTKENNQVKIAKLSMIDLAGSERGMATGCKGMRFKEGSNINKSLLALGNCISSLADGLRHIPYRDSKLTRILKDSLGGNCYTIMIANVSPSSASYEDTYNTLKYATRAKKIKTKLTKNIMSTDMHVSHYLKLVEELKKENTLLKSQVRALELTVADSGRATSSQPDTSIWCNHLDILFEEKKKLRLQLLNVRSEAKVLEYRIKLMNETKNKMEDFDDAPAARIVKMESSLSQFEARLEVVQGRIKELIALLDANKTKLLQLYNEMEEARVLKYMEKEIALRTAMLRNAEYEVMGKHYLRLITMQQKRDSENTVALTNLQDTLSNFYRVLSGMNRITIDMKTSYQTAIQALEGIKSVSWSDEGLDNLTPRDVRTAINISIDDSLSNLNPESFKPILKPMVLSIMDEVEVEPNLVEMEEVEAAEETPLNVTADIAISILDTIERPKIQPLENSEVKENNDALSKNNETLNITEKDKNNVVKVANVPVIKPKKNTFIFPRLKPLSKPDLSISKKSNKENIHTTNELFKTPMNKGFSNTAIRPTTKTPAPNRLQQRSALKPKVVNIQSDPNTTVILSSSAPSKDSVDSFKLIHIKKKIKYHPYKRQTNKKT